jgi:hypothetical protein
MASDAPTGGDVEESRLNSAGRRQRRDRHRFETVVGRREGFGREPLHVATVLARPSAV